MKPKRDLPKDDLTEKVFQIINRIKDIESFGAKKLAKEISLYQPGSVEVFLGFQLEYEGNRELNEILKILFVIWEYYKEKKNIKSVKLTSGQFDTIFHMHSELSRNLQGEPTENEVENHLLIGLDKIESKALFTGLYHWYLNNPIIYDKEEGVNVFLFKEIRCIIDCFDAIVDDTISSLKIIDWDKIIDK